MAARFSRLFDDWDQDHGDINMLEFGSNINQSPPDYHSSHNSSEYTSYSANISERPEPILQRQESTTPFTPFDDGISSRRLLDGRGSYASSFSPSLPSAHDYQALKGLGRDSLTEDSPPSEARLRKTSGVTLNMKRIWTKSTAFAKPRPSSTFDGQFAQGKDGWWKKQMLVDRSLRSMAGFTFLCAIIMFIIMMVYLPAFYHRLNKNSTSMGGKDGEGCESMERRNIAARFFISIAATMVLGCSNTYQQLATAPVVEEIPYILSKRGDFIGPSFYIEMPTNVSYFYNATFTLGPYDYSFNNVDSLSNYDSACWTAFRAGFYVLPRDIRQLSNQYNTLTLKNSTSFKTVSVTYNQNCTTYKGTATVDEAQKEVDYASTQSSYGLYVKGNCALRQNVYCELEDQQPSKCRLNVRMQACFIPSITGDDIGHCQKCKRFNEIDKAADLLHPSIAIKYKRSLLSNLGSTAIPQMIILMFCSFAMVGLSIIIITAMANTASNYHPNCAQSNKTSPNHGIGCDANISKVLEHYYGTWGGFSSSATLASLPSDKISSELLAFVISNGAQFLFSLLYLLLIYNVTLISMEHEWGTFELHRRKPRATIVSGTPFEQSYFLQLPSKVLLPLMMFASAMHWLLGESVSTIETIYTDPAYGVEHSVYFVTYASYPIFLMGMGAKFRHAGFSTDEPGKIVPGEIYCGRG
ncbi:hypothetical protein SBOR_4100 [Sclerotinia borealis F-4128]|uniref:DUF6536 domain-containing protein n=1 Tax=Sclerotinia borealis (strain F-4128) TaxID=1432307 RepID=W9CLW5_SCLBF|nr:hypothetical protein SBOR_4100 [Sclerotinia borealis F-4128]